MPLHRRSTLCAPWLLARGLAPPWRRRPGAGLPVQDHQVRGSLRARQRHRHLGALLRQKAGTWTGQAVVVENKPGANGFLAVKQVLTAPADGYTVFIGQQLPLAVNAALFWASRPTTR